MLPPQRAFRQKNSSVIVSQRSSKSRLRNRLIAPPTPPGTRCESREQKGNPPQTRTPGRAAKVDSAQLDQQLHSLEVEVARAVALRRSSELFARADYLETQYAKANELNPTIRKRFGIRRVTMAKKLPGGSTPGAMDNLFFSRPVQ
jgi:hypothetical protein